MIKQFFSESEGISVMDCYLFILYFLKIEATLLLFPILVLFTWVIKTALKMNANSNADLVSIYVRARYGIVSEEDSCQRAYK